MDSDALYNFFESFRGDIDAKEEVKDLLFKYDEIETKVKLFLDKYIVFDNEETKVFQLKKYLGIGSITAAGITIISIFTYFLLQNIPKQENKSLTLNKNDNKIEKNDNNQNKESENNENITDKLPKNQTEKLPKNQTDTFTNGETQKKQNIKKENQTESSNRNITQKERQLISPKENDVVREDDLYVEWTGLDEKYSLEVQIRNIYDFKVHTQIVKNKEKISIPKSIEDDFYIVTIKALDEKKTLVFKTKIELKREKEKEKQ
ncbi:MAG: hypothetical protein EAZ85_03105 [Bacteroidetes bacterium]|nr:MAG: hypothetical protein EAZ85_03105 [Bacteroidota bacterium]